MSDAEWKAQARLEERAERSFVNYLTRNRDLLRNIAHFGDGECGEMLETMKDILGVRIVPREKAYKKKKIGSTLRKAVLERDQYRCQHCGTHVDLCLDHLIAEKNGGPTTLENLQALCRSCNSKKGCK